MAKRKDGEILGRTYVGGVLYSLVYNEEDNKIMYVPFIEPTVEEITE